MKHVIEVLQNLWVFFFLYLLCSFIWPLDLVLKEFRYLLGMDNFVLYCIKKLALELSYGPFSWTKNALNISSNLCPKSKGHLILEQKETEPKALLWE